jgi:hypothetical protein
LGSLRLGSPEPKVPEGRHLEYKSDIPVSNEEHDRQLRDTIKRNVKLASKLGRVIFIHSADSLEIVA